MNDQEKDPQQTMRDLLVGAVYGVEERKPFESESEYFRANPSVAGMAAEDDRIVLNPFSTLSPQELEAVRMNEAARVHMRRGQAPEFDLTPEQAESLAGTTYQDAPEQDRRATIAARIISGDPSARQPTPQQMDYVQALRALMGVEKND
jgi:hypothetical protein